MLTEYYNQNPRETERLIKVLELHVELDKAERANDKIRCSLENLLGNNPKSISLAF